MSWLAEVLSNAPKHYDQATLKSLILVTHWDQVSPDRDDFSALGAALSLPHFPTFLGIRVVFIHYSITEPGIRRLLHDNTQAVWNALKEAGLKGRVNVESRQVPSIDTYFKDL